MQHLRVRPARTRVTHGDVIISYEFGRYVLNYFTLFS